MADRGRAYTGNRGEQYARHLDNAVLLDTVDPAEAALYVDYLKTDPKTQLRLRERTHHRSAVRLGSRARAVAWPRPGTSSGQSSEVGIQRMRQ